MLLKTGIKCCTLLRVDNLELLNEAKQYFAQPTRLEITQTPDHPIVQ